MIPTLTCIGEYIGDEYYRPHWALSFTRFPPPAFVAVMRGDIPCQPIDIDQERIPALLLTGHQFNLSIAHVAAIVGNFAALQRVQSIFPDVGDIESEGGGLFFFVFFAALLGGYPNCIEFALAHSAKKARYSSSAIVHYNACLSGSMVSATYVESHVMERTETLRLDQRVLCAAMCGDIKDVDQCFLKGIYPVDAQLNMYKDLQGFHPMFMNVHPIFMAALCGNIRVVMALLEREPSLVEAVDAHHRTPLHYATTGGQMDVIRALIRYGAKLDVKDVTEGTPLHFAAVSGQLTALHYLTTHQPDADLFKKDARQRSVLHYAAYAGRVDGIKFLCSRLPQASAHMRARDSEGHTPHSIAVKSLHNEEFLDLLAAEDP